MSSHRLRVLVVHNRYRSEQPSGENRMVDQETALLSDAGHQVDVFERDSDDIASMSLRSRAMVPLRVPWNAPARQRLAARLRSNRPDVVHIHNTFPLLSPSVVAACTDVRVPTVATLHNYRQVCPTGTLFRDGQVCTDCVAHGPLPAISHGCYRDSRLATVPIAVNVMANRKRWWSDVARFFCISDEQRKVLVQAGMPAHRLTVKHNFVADPGTRRRGPGKHLLYLGRLDSAKGVRVLMKAWDSVAADGGFGIPLVLAGSGPLQDEVSQWARDRSDVVYQGLRNKTECRELTTDAVAMVAPSTWVETFGLTVAEAMAAGVPSVAAAHGGFVDLVEDGVTGLLHRPGDSEALAESLRRVVASAETNLRMGEAARRRYEANFSPSVGLNRLLRGYEAAMREHGGAAHTGRSPANRSTTKREGP